MAPSDLRLQCLYHAFWVTQTLIPGLLTRTQTHLPMQRNRANAFPKYPKVVCTCAGTHRRTRSQVSNLPISHPFPPPLASSTEIIVLYHHTQALPPLIHQSHSIQGTYVVSHSTLGSFRCAASSASLARPLPLFARFLNDTQASEPRQSQSRTGL